MKHLTIAANVETLTPATAQEWLDGQIENNRKLSDNHVKMLAHAMELGHWQLNGEAIKFNKHGQMTDGQHRCAAVIRSGKSIQVLVVRGLEDSAFVTLDGRGIRRVSDFLHCANAKTRASVIVFLVRFLENRSIFPGSKIRVTPSQAMECDTKYKDFIDDGTAWARACSPLGPGSPMGFLFMYYAYLSPRSNPASVSKFADLLISGAGMAETHPAFRLREWFMLRNAKHGVRIDQRVQLAMTIKAYKAFRDGFNVKVLRWSDAEKFPELE